MEEDDRWADAPKDAQYASPGRAYRKIQNGVVFEWRRSVWAWVAMDIPKEVWFIKYSRFFKKRPSKFNETTEVKDQPKKVGWW